MSQDDLEAVTARHQDEPAREDAERMLRSVLDASPIPILTLDRQGNVTRWNRGAERTFGWTEAEVLGKPSPTIPEDAKAASDEVVARVVQGEIATGLIRRRRRKDGSPIDLIISTGPLYDDNGAIIGTVVIGEDISDQMALERQKDEFLSAAAHDLRSPLTVIKGTVQLLRRRLNSESALSTDDILKGLERIEATAARMTDLIGDLLDVTRIQMGVTLDLALAPLDLVPLIRRVVDDLRETSEQHSIVMSCEEEYIEGTWDAARLHRVLHNLLENALKYSPGGGTVTVAAKRIADDALIEVIDTGVGIPDAELPRIFERFYRGTNVAERITGTGVGLAAVKQIVEEHGGTIDVRSREGEGSTFTVRLPIAHSHNA